MGDDAAEEWSLFEDAATSASRQRMELVERLRQRMIAAGDKLSLAQIDALVARMADAALDGDRLRYRPDQPRR